MPHNGVYARGRCPQGQMTVTTQRNISGNNDGVAEREAVSVFGRFV